MADVAVNVKNSKKVVLYCDRCAGLNGLVIQDHKVVKAQCQLCHQFIGPLNETSENNHVHERKTKKFGGFTVEQMQGFIPGMNPKNIHPHLTYEIKSQDLVLYFPSADDDRERRKTLIICNPLTGEQIRLILSAPRKAGKPVMSINAK